eukprot:scaffold71839_cov21-Prasinocladus_malaysianus.AAC.1
MKQNDIDMLPCRDWQGVAAVKGAKYGGVCTMSLCLCWPMIYFYMGLRGQPGNMANQTYVTLTVN